MGSNSLVHGSSSPSPIMSNSPLQGSSSPSPIVTTSPPSPDHVCSMSAEFHLSQPIQIEDANVGQKRKNINLPSRHTVKRDIMKIYEAPKVKSMGLLDKVGSRIAITTDLWTASNEKKKGFMAITSHFIDENWALQSRILRFAYLPCPHTTESISSTLVECLLDWNIDRKLSTINLDNCSTNDSLINSLLMKLDTSSLLLDGQLFHMRCCAHILNLIVQDGLAMIVYDISKVRSSVVFWSATPKREQTFREAARQLKISYVFNRLKAREPLHTSVPTENDCELTREICGRLEIFNRVAKVFSGTQYPTTNLFFPLICEIRLSIQNWLSSSKEIIRNMASKMMEKFEKYLFVVHGIMGVAIVLDPRYKFKNVKDVGSNTDGPTLIDATYDILKRYDSFVEEIEDTMTKTELELYLKEKVTPREPPIDILKWWRHNGGIKYPILQKMIRDILVIPISTIT
ncbi:zinc finger BED domain-containing protein RICESLEEPER 2-like [Senna tora]|uniref:Zinc finger BED domain-containing protein RICESLEEPER 2-like n=1 Tax=Senna tora TaxID=362788 RepID=A0A834VZ96_9FABA|nr:zinc finger BED domain-containing protein RICESLEEPER 2-like [Senna tora]